MFCARFLAGKIDRAHAHVLIGRAERAHLVDLSARFFISSVRRRLNAHALHVI